MDIEKRDQLVITMLTSFEGFSPKVYKDSAGVETIGYGTTNKDIITKFRHTTITHEQAQEYLIDHLRITVYPIIDKTIKVNLNVYQWSGLVSWIYNLGSGRFQKSGIIDLINQGDLSGAAALMVKYYKAFNPKTGTKEPLLGLMRRRLTESFLFLGYSPNEVQTNLEDGFELWLRGVKKLSYDECLAYVMDVEYNQISN